jgi:hypothetical protein
VSDTDKRVEEVEASLFGGVVAKDFFQLAIYDANHQHIVTLRLGRREGHTDGDMHQLQNFLWTQVGQVIKDDEELQRRLELGGIEVLLEDPNPPQAPAGAS